ncbi:MAG: hypothetical protein P1V20_25075, partial [Verrucomicrobiales bacterium]|nr:hypothetical protein [Verrucomicrobiales bacterium]
MKRESVWLILLLIGFNATGRGFAQAGERFETRSVEWPGLGRTTAVCVKKGGLYVCVLPGGEGVADQSPKVFNEKGEEQPAKLLHCDNESGICLLESPSGSEAAILPLAAGADFHPGQSLLSLLPGAELKTRLAGKDRIYLGKELPAPMLRLRVEQGYDWQPGTPVINKEGELEGIMASRKLPRANEAHAVPADVIRKVINDV